MGIFFILIAAIPVILYFKPKKKEIVIKNYKKLKNIVYQYNRLDDISNAGGTEDGSAEKKIWTNIKNLKRTP